MSEGISWSVSDRHAQQQKPAQAFVIRAGTSKDRCFIIASATDKIGPEDDAAAAMVNAIYFPTQHLDKVIALLLQRLHPLAAVAILAQVCSGEALAEPVKDEPDGG